MIFLQIKLYTSPFATQIFDKIHPAQPPFKYQVSSFNVGLLQHDNWVEKSKKSGSSHKKAFKTGSQTFVGATGMYTAIYEDIS